MLGLATALATGMAGASFAAGGSLGSQNTTQTQLRAGGQNQMLSKPATGSAQPGTNTYGMNGSTSTQYGNSVNTPTTPDAANPSAMSPSGGGSGGSAGGGASAGGGTGGGSGGAGGSR